ncbi:hypothetical protein A2U01_0069173, partial [Trifolium medium]|nr:hypothetical protein [Trifolium medium]
MNPEAEFSPEAIEIPSEISTSEHQPSEHQPPLNIQPSEIQPTSETHTKPIPDQNSEH